MTGTLTITGLTKRFGGATALDDVTLEIEAGGFLALLGPSGCGKSTLLRCIAGFEEPDAGEIAFDGRVLFSRAKGISVPPGKRGLGMVFQSYALWPHMTVLDNVAFGLELAGLGKTARREQALRALADVGLDSYEHRYPSQLSGGQQQRVALARLIATKPPVFLMDEPLSNLDARLRMDMREELRRLHDASGALTIYVTHDQGEAMSMADTVVVMRGGSVEQAASPADVYERPASTFVADFVGMPRMNLIDAMVSVEGARHRLSFAGFRFDVSSQLAPGAYRIGFRPEDVSLAGTGTEGTVRGVFPSGHEVILTVEAGAETLLIRQMRGSRVRPGETVALGLDLRHLNIFDSASGRLIEIDPAAIAVGDRKIASA